MIIQLLVLDKVDILKEVSAVPVLVDQVLEVSQVAKVALRVVATQELDHKVLVVDTQVDKDQQVLVDIQEPNHLREALVDTQGLDHKDLAVDTQVLEHHQVHQVVTQGQVVHLDPQQEVTQVRKDHKVNSQEDQERQVQQEAQVATPVADLALHSQDQVVLDNQAHSSHQESTCLQSMVKRDNADGVEPSTSERRLYKTK